MKLDKRLFIAGRSVPIINDDALLQLSDTGRASFDIVSASEPSGIVMFDVRYRTGNWTTFFIGFIKKATRKSNQHYFILCRELSNALRLPCPVSLRSCVLTDVLDRLNEVTALTYKMGNHAYSSTLQPRFQSLGNGYDVLANIARVFSIDDFIWQQMINGDVFIGSWRDSTWHNKDVFLSDDFYMNQQAQKQATIPVLPSLRPGALLNNKRVTQVRLIKNQMIIKWNH